MPPKLTEQESQQAEMMEYDYGLTDLDYERADDERDCPEQSIITRNDVQHYLAPTCLKSSNE